MLSWQTPAHSLALTFCPLPGYSAMISPVFGFCSSAPTSIHGGSDDTEAFPVAAIAAGVTVFLTAAYIWASIVRLIVVTIL